MSESNCYDNTTILQYLENKLQFEDIASIERHFYNCRLCANKARFYSEALYILNSLKPNNRTIKSLKNANIDLVVLPAANSLKNSATSNTKSMHGKYFLNLIPIIGENKILLKVQILDKQITGNLIIQNDNNILFSAPIKNGFACEELDTPVDLRNVLIYVNTSD